MSLSQVGYDSGVGLALVMLTMVYVDLIIIPSLEESGDYSLLDALRFSTFELIACATIVVLSTVGLEVARRSYHRALRQPFAYPSQCIKKFNRNFNIIVALMTISAVLTQFV